MKFKRSMSLLLAIIMLITVMVPAYVYTIVSSAETNTVFNITNDALDTSSKGWADVGFSPENYGVTRPVAEHNPDGLSLEFGKNAGYWARRLLNVKNSVAISGDNAGVVAVISTDEFTTRAPKLSFGVTNALKHKFTVMSISKTDGTVSVSRDINSVYLTSNTINYIIISPKSNNVTVNKNTTFHILAEAQASDTFKYYLDALGYTDDIEALIAEYYGVEPEPLFSVTANMNSDEVTWCDHKTKGYVKNRPKTIHNTDGQSYKFGPVTGAGGWPFVDVRTNLPSNETVNALVLVLSSDENSKTKYPVRLGIGGQNIQNFTLVSIGQDGKVSVAENQNLMSLNPGTTNYLIVEDKKYSGTFNSSTTVRIWSDFPPGGYESIYYIDSIGYTDNANTLIDVIKEASKPELEMKIKSGKNYANISWDKNKDIDALNYRVTIYDTDNKVVDEYTTTNMRITTFLDRNTTYNAMVESLDEDSKVTGKSAKLSFSTADYKSFYTVTNTFDTVGGTFNYSARAKNLKVYDEKPSLWHPDGKYASFDLNGKSSVEVWTYTGIDGLNSGDAKGVVYMVEGGSNITWPNGKKPLTFLWSNKSFGKYTKCWHVVSIDKKTGERTFYKDMDKLAMDMEVYPNTVNFIILELEENVDISGVNVEAHFWNDTTGNNYNGTVYLDDYGITTDVYGLIGELMVPNSNVFVESTSNIVVDIDAISTIADIYYTPADTISDVEEYHIKFYSADQDLIFTESSKKKLDKSPTSFNIEPGGVYAVQVVGKDKNGKIIAASDVETFSSPQSDVNLLVSGSVTETKLNWSVPKKAGYLNKFDICWYKKDGEKLTKVDEVTVNDTNEYTIKKLFPEDTYQIEVYAYNADGSKNIYPGKEFVTMKKAVALELVPHNTKITAKFTISPELVKYDKSRITLYEIDKDKNEILVETKNTSEDSVVFENLRPLQKYKVEIIALDSNGKDITYVLSQEISTTTDLTLSFTSDIDSIHLTWQPVQTLTDIATYRVDWYSFNADKSLTLLESINTTETELVKDGLPQATKYAAWVYAYDENGVEIALSNRLIVFTKAPTLYTVTNDFTKGSPVSYNNFTGKKMIVTEEPSIYHPDGTFYMFTAGGGAHYPINEVRTNFSSADMEDAEALVFMLRVSEECNGYPLWLLLLGSSIDTSKCKITVVSIDMATGDKTVSNWAGGRIGNFGRQFSAGTANYVVVQLPEDSDYSEISLVQFQSPNMELNSKGTTLFIDDVGYTTDAIGLLSSISERPEYEFEPYKEDTKISVVVNDKGGNWAEFEWNKISYANNYMLNIYKKTSGGYYEFVDSIQTTELSQKYNLLSVKTTYVIQAVAVDKNGNCITASKLIEFTTDEKNEPIYKFGFVEYKKGYCPNYVILFPDGELISKWPFISGAHYTIVALYEKIDGNIVYLDFRTVEDRDNVSFDDLDTSKEYYLQVILMDETNNVIFGYEPMKAISMKRPTKLVATLIESEYEEVFEDKENFEAEEQQTTRRKKKYMKKVITQYGGYDYTLWIILGSVVAVIVAGGIVIIIVLKRKKKNR